MRKTIDEVVAQTHRAQALAELMTMKKGRRSIPAAQFKSQCLAILDRVGESRESVVVTKRERPVARVVPLEERSPRSMRGSVLERGDIVRPLGESWDAER